MICTGGCAKFYGVAITKVAFQSKRTSSVFAEVNTTSFLTYMYGITQSTHRESGFRTCPIVLTYIWHSMCYESELKDIHYLTFLFQVAVIDGMEADEGFSEDGCRT